MCSLTCEELASGEPNRKEAEERGGGGRREEVSVDIWYHVNEWWSTSLAKPDCYARRLSLDNCR